MGSSAEALPSSTHKAASDLALETNHVPVKVGHDELPDLGPVRVAHRYHSVSGSISCGRVR